VEAIKCGFVGAFMFAVIYYFINPNGVAKMGEQGKNFYLVDNDLIRWQDSKNMIVSGYAVIPPQIRDLLDYQSNGEIWRYEFTRIHFEYNSSNAFFNGQVRPRRIVGKYEPPLNYL
jgi:hypothetical protein